MLILCCILLDVGRPSFMVRDVDLIEIHPNDETGAFPQIPRMIRYLLSAAGRFGFRLPDVSLSAARRARVKKKESPVFRRTLKQHPLLVRPSIVGGTRYNVLVWYCVVVEIEEVGCSGLPCRQPNLVARCGM